MEAISNIDKYCKLAQTLGADNVKVITTKEVVFDGRTLLKCMFGCSSWEKGCTCPSREGFPKPWELEPLFRKYNKVLIIHSTDKSTAQKAAYAVEREAFLDGDALAFSTSDCALCEKCAGEMGLECRNVAIARPAFHSIGVDVFTTARNLGLPIEPLRCENDRQNWYSAVWLN